MQAANMLTRWPSRFHQPPIIRRCGCHEKNVQRINFPSNFGQQNAVELDWNTKSLNMAPCAYNICKNEYAKHDSSNILLVFVPAVYENADNRTKLTYPEPD